MTTNQTPDSTSGQAATCNQPLIRHPIHGEPCERDKPCPVHDGDPETEMRTNRLDKLKAADRFREAGETMVRLDKEYLVLERRKQKP